MEENYEKMLRELTAKAERLTMQQQNLALEIRQLRDEVNNLNLSQSKTLMEKIEVAFPTIEQPKVVISPPEPVKTQSSQPVYPVTPKVSKPKVKTPLEEFIGTNLLNKIGIAVLVIGLGIGAKYAIDHDMINELTRSILGYFSGLVLIGLAIRLKARYAPFSAVLLSGGMAVLYFMTYVTYDSYQLIPQTFAFILMVIFTGFTVFASLQYNMRVIAIIGLVGAYAVPFLLSDGSGRVGILFSYMVIINSGILVLSFRKAWKVLYYTAFGLTWLIYAAWFMDRYSADDHLWLSIGFSTIFFITFYTSFLSYKLLQQETLKVWDVVLLLLNSFLYYGFGYAAIAQHEQGELFLGLFTVFNAVLHFIACYLIYKRQDATRDTFYLVAGMVLVFLTLAVPVQLDGHWVTIIWAAEGVLLFWIGRTKKFPVYERIAYAMVVLTFVSLLHDWQVYYPYSNYYSYFENVQHTPFLLNIQVLSSLLVCMSWGAIIFLGLKNKPDTPKHFLTTLFEWIVPILFISVLYMIFYKEIDAFWQQRYFESTVKNSADGYDYNIYDEDLKSFGRLWLMIYSSLFIMIVAFANYRWIKNTILSYAISIASAFLLLSFVTAGLYSLYLLRSSYLEPQYSDYYFRDGTHIGIRYLCLVVMLPLLWIIYRNVRADKLPPVVIQIERAFFHLVILVLLSSELITILDLLRIHNSDRLALSILWGVYALALIVYGLMKDQKLIRILAFVIFGVTLIKLFFYDMAEMSTISKTVVMVILGALLLIASFIYNKYKAARHEE
jgi:hypothetical protein